MSCTHGSGSSSPIWAVPPSGWSRSTISAARLSNGSRRAKTRSGGHACRAAGSDHNAVRLQLHALAYNLGNFMRTLALPDAVEQWSLTSLREKLIKIGAKIVLHGRYCSVNDAGFPNARLCAILGVMRIPACIWLCPEDRVRLERLIAERNTPLEGGLALADRASVGGRDAAPWRSCGAPGSQSRRCGAGRRVTWRPGSMACCATRAGRRGRRR